MHTYKLTISTGRARVLLSSLAAPPKTEHRDYCGWWGVPPSWRGTVAHEHFDARHVSWVPSEADVLIQCMDAPESFPAGGMRASDFHGYGSPLYVLRDPCHALA